MTSKGSKPAPLAPGWAEALGKATTASAGLDRRPPMWRISTAAQYRSQLNGSRNGGVDKGRKLDRVLGKVDEEG